MFTLLSFPCVARRITQRSHPAPVIIEDVYVGLYHTEHGLYLCDVTGGGDSGIWLLHASELFESCFLAQLHCQSAAGVAA